MDFTPTAEQQDAAALARDILRDRCTPGRLAEVESTGTRFDRDLWRRLGDAGLVGIALPEDVGGAGLDLLELCSVLVECGRAVAPLPLAAHACAAEAIAVHGTEEQRRGWLPDAVAARSVLTVALAEDRAFAPARPATTAGQTDDGWSVSGVKTVVPAGTVADAFVVPVDTERGVTVLVVLPDDPGVTVLPQILNDGDTAGRLELDGAQVPAGRVIGQPGAGGVVLDDLVPRLTTAWCAQQLGVLEGALALTAAYAGSREQFGRPIGTFQAVSQRLADAYIDVQGARLTLWQAAWRLAEGLPADVEVAVAKLWASDAGHRLAHTTVHVHGGVGIDLDGEAHRYFTAAKRLELALGGSTAQALAVGRALAAEPA
jgi:alkylation response protein AidB-like acyl-CoA dehydrogenase